MSVCVCACFCAYVCVRVCMCSQKFFTARLTVPQLCYPFLVRGQHISLYHDICATLAATSYKVPQFRVYCESPRRQIHINFHCERVNHEKLVCTKMRCYLCEHNFHSKLCARLEGGGGSKLREKNKPHPIKKGSATTSHVRVLVNPLEVLSLNLHLSKYFRNKSFS